ncbi:MAG: hypothetical protein JXL81_13255 [Deltaproteobacteria bacterium]|nr:hypothetical protein [Deltaproteobacteria bacterium]
MKLRIILSILILLSSGCATTPVSKVRNLHYSESPVHSDLILEECEGVSRKDRLLCYMEGGIILYDQEAYKESTDILLKASRIIQKQDMVNIKDQSSAVIINDRIMKYKGEYSERLWVHTYLMMSFIMQNNYESALVEAKQALELYDAYPESLEKDYFTRALIALCFENMNLPDDARIEYDKLAEAAGGEGYRPEPIEPGKGELVLFIGQGYIPTKETIETVFPPSIRISIPHYPDSYPPPPANVRCDRMTGIPVRVTTDLGDVVRTSLNDRAAQYLTRQALRAGIKESIADKVGEKNEFAEILVRALLFVSEEADTRSWETLPESLTLIRVTLDPGVHDIIVSTEYSQRVILRDIDIQDGKRIYRSLRF